MDTSHHTKTHSTRSRKMRLKQMGSAALMRRDQEMKGHERLGVVGDERTTPQANSGKYGNFGTIGSKLSRPER